MGKNAPFRGKNTPLLRALLLFTLLLTSSQLFSQSTFKGVVVDESDQLKLANAAIILLHAQDSILVDFTRADQDGKFTLNKPAEGNFLLLVTYPKYGEYNRHIDASTDADLGTIGLSTITNLIEEVIVQGRIPVVIKGDTTEYDASSFEVEKNAKVEDLLRVLPGITVDADGNITAQGKSVEKVLVDGEEFFGDDPTLVTRNIRSDMVDKVQVFEKRSEEAERTGVDDGVRQQTINVTLKEDAKKGYFGKAEAAGGSDLDYGYYLGKLALNRFNGPQKISAFGMTSNTGEISLNWQEAERFNISNDAVTMMDDGSMVIMASGDSFSSWDGRGKPQAISTGLSYMDAWKDNAHRLNLNYKFGRIQNEVEEGSISQNNLPQGQINSENSSNRISDANRHRVNTKYDWKLDSLTTLTVRLSAGQEASSLDMATQAATTDGSGSKLNDNERFQTRSSDKTNYTYDAYLTRRMQKPGRSLSFRFAGDGAEDTGNAFLRSTTNIYLQGVIDSTQVIDQMKDIRSTSNNIRTSLSYSEPLATSWSTSLNYEFTHSATHAINDSYNQDNQGQYVVFDEEFSNDFDFNTVRHSANLSINYKTEKITANLTNNLRNDDLFQRNNHQQMELNRDFTTFNPRFNLSYNISSSQSISAYLSRSNRLPSLSQIQPLRQNTDPLNIVVGNENLSPSSSNSFSLIYNSYNMLKGTYSFINLDWTQQYNSIQQNVLIDPETGIRTAQFENISDKVANTFYFYFTTSYDIVRNLQIKGDIGGNGNFSQHYNFINGVLNENQNNLYGVNVSARKNTTKGLDFQLSFSPGWRTLNNSLQPEFNSSGFTFGSRASYTWHLPLQIALYGNLTYQYEAPTAAFDEKFERLLFSPGVRKKFLSDESLVVDLSVNDLFNQNVGFRRYQSGNMITQNSYNTISRYFMLKVSWDFTSMGGNN